MSYRSGRGPILGLEAPPAGLLLLLIGAALAAAGLIPGGRDFDETDPRERVAGFWERTDGQVSLNFLFGWTCHVLHAIEPTADGRLATTLPVDLGGVRLTGLVPSHRCPRSCTAAHRRYGYHFETPERLTLTPLDGSAEYPLQLCIRGRPLLVVVPYRQARYWRPQAYDVSVRSNGGLVLRDTQTGQEALFLRASGYPEPVK